jgi:hypothetical protein
MENTFFNEKYIALIKKKKTKPEKIRSTPAKLGNTK